MNLNTEAFIDTLPIMAEGMACIFAVTAVIIISTYLLNVFTRPKKDKDKTEDTNQ